MQRKDSLNKYYTHLAVHDMNIFSNKKNQNLTTRGIKESVLLEEVPKNVATYS